MRSSDVLALGAAAALLTAGVLWLAVPAAAVPEPTSAAAMAGAGPARPLLGTAAVRTALPPAEIAPPPPSAGPALGLGPVPVGTIEVVAQSEEGPPPRGVARVHATATEDVWSAALAADGTARIGKLPEGQYYWVEFEFVDGSVVGTKGRYQLKHGEGWRRVFRFGSASVHGTTYGADGTPAQGIAVEVEGDGWCCYGATDASGRYEVGHLPAGVRLVTLLREHGVKLALGERPLQHVHHAPHTAQRVDFGSAQGLVAWSGAVRTSGAAPLVAAAELHLRRAGDGRHHELRTNSDGTFVVRLEPGTWSVEVTPPCVRWGSDGSWSYGRQAIPGPLEIGATSVQRDLTLTGARVRVRVTIAASPEPWLDRLKIRTEPTRGALEYGAVPTGDGTFVFEGLPAGTWLLTAWPRQPTAPRAIVVRPSDVELEADLEVR